MIRNFFLSGLIAVLVSCSPSVRLEGFDSQAWKSDKMGCKNIRASLLASFQENKNKFMDISEKQLIALLGKPDQIELSTRHQRFFYYFVEGGSQCDTTKTTLGKRVSIRLNSLDMVNEITFTKM